MVECNKLKLHYYFNDDSHNIDALFRNQCENELLHIFTEISNSLDLKLYIESEPPKEGGFAEFWKFLSDNNIQITLLITLATLIVSRKPVENKKLTQLQIENLELDNELKRKELEKLNLKTLTENDITNDLITKLLDLLMLNYKIIWRRSNFYKKANIYPKITKISTQRFLDDIPIGNEKQVRQDRFSNYILHSDELPDIEIEEAQIDLISPVLKPGKFLWKGFYSNQIISFEMLDDTFQSMVQHGKIKFNSNVSISTVMNQKRKIDDKGAIKASKIQILLVIDYTIDGVKYITDNGALYKK
ncbi:hypothetical protein ACLI09_00100 [Flavobacterium sp. RHBU_24]|uniref:hypothetical protein n=1 Tax=Flavobacterium sp. RHBU_24 TaxID=3391185 RepID=UPI00398461B8